MLLVKILKYIFVGIFTYISIFFSIYIVSGFLLISGITPEIKLINNYQRNFYLWGGLRDIWQSHKECVEFDQDLIFIPKENTCKFKNFEFDSYLKVLTFLSFENLFNTYIFESTFLILLRNLLSSIMNTIV